MGQTLKKGADGHLLRNGTTGHLVNDCGWMDYPITMTGAGAGAYFRDGGWINPAAGSPPNAADYNTAFGDLPNQSVGGTEVDCGYTWPWEVVGSATVSCYGALGQVDTSNLQTVTAARLVVTLNNAGDDTWSGPGDDGVTLDINHNDVAAPANTSINTALAYGTNAGSITVTNAQVQQTYNLIVGDVDVNGTFWCVIVPDIADNPGYPGGDVMYFRSISMTVVLQVQGTLD